MYTVIYRIGGPARFSWRRTFDQYRTMKAAIDKQREIERMGYKALIFDSDELNRHGMPTTWD